MSFFDRLARAVTARGPAVIGIDPHLDRLPAPLADLPAPDAVRAFCLAAVDAAAAHAAMIKPQSAFFEQLGAAGVAVLEEVVAHARSQDLLVLLDAKRNDIGSTARAYARATLGGHMQADAVTVSPYLGPESLDPFLADEERGIFVLLRTSNPGAGPWQAAMVPHLAAWVRQANAGGERVGVVVGATLPGDEVRELRARCPRAWFLAPGVGPQGATLDDCNAHARADGSGVVVPASRAVLFPTVGRDGADWQGALTERIVRFVSACATKGVS